MNKNPTGVSPKQDKMFDERARYFYDIRLKEGLSHQEISDRMENDGWEPISRKSVSWVFASNRMKRIIKEKEVK